MLKVDYNFNEIEIDNREMFEEFCVYKIEQSVEFVEQFLQVHSLGGCSVFRVREGGVALPPIGTFLFCDRKLCSYLLY